MLLLGHQAGADLGLERQLVEHERHRRGGGVVAREQERHDLVADLHVAERGAVLVLGVQQQAEDVVAAAAVPSPRGDLPVDHRVQLAGGPLHPRPRAAAVAAHPQQVLAGVEGQRLLEGRRGIDRAGRLTIGVHPEQRPHGDPHRQVPGPAVQVHGRAGSQHRPPRARSPPAPSRPRPRGARGEMPAA